MAAPVRFPVPITRTKMTRMPLPVLATTGTGAHVAYRLKQGQSRLFHRLPSGLRMEVIFQKKKPESDPSSDDPNTNPPLVFVHGSFHAAWCWAEHWLPFFSGAGYDSYAISLLGQGESDVPTGPVAGTLQTHTSDIADFIRKEVSSSPVLIGHSFGGLIVQSYLSNMNNKFYCPSSSGRDDLLPILAGAVLLCSVPPSGNSGLVWRYLLTKPIAAIKVTLSLAAKGFAKSLPLCKETFFSSTIEDQIVQRYQVLMRESSKLPLLDLKKLNASLPVASVPRSSLDLLIVGASDDFIVDEEGLHETARFYDTHPVCIQGVAHDMMLDSSWEKGAKIISSWIKFKSMAESVESQFDQFNGSAMEYFNLCFSNDNFLPFLENLPPIESPKPAMDKKRKLPVATETNSIDSSKNRGRSRSKDQVDDPKEVVHVRARRGQATDSHSLAERGRREKINERMKFLQDLVPGCYKTMGMAGVLDEIINYVQSLQNQVEFLSMKLTAASSLYDFSLDMEAMIAHQMLQREGNVHLQGQTIERLAKEQEGPFEF